VLLQNLRDGRRQRRLAMVNVTNRPYVAVRLIPFKFFLRHFRFAPSSVLAGTVLSKSVVYFAVP